MAWDLYGKNALITGGARRLGRALALALAGEGVNIAIHFRHSENAAKQLAKDLTGLGVKTWIHAGNLQEEKDVRTLIPRSWEAAGHLDILINNAATYPKAALENMTLAHLLQNIRINAWAPLALSREFARRAKFGKIINLLDTHVDDEDSEHAGYLLSKCLLQKITRLLAKQYAPRVLVNGLAPGLILPPPGKNASYLTQLGKQLPLQRHGTPEDVAAAAIYLLKNDFVTGEVVYIDGGRRLKGT